MILIVSYIIIVGVSMGILYMTYCKNNENEGDRFATSLLMAFFWPIMIPFVATINIIDAWSKIKNEKSIDISEHLIDDES